MFSAVGRILRGILSVALIFLITALVLEIGARVLFAVKLRDTGVLTYPWQYKAVFRYGQLFGRIQPRKVMDGYRKYYPDPQKRIYVHSEKGDLVPDFTTINSRGFRGRELPPEKESGVVRVICLGESSTFGAFNRDEGTYPRLLERLLNNDAENGRYEEVFNFGVSESASEQTRDMIEAEILSANPDIVTYYGGHNDIRNFLIGKPGVLLPEEYREEWAAARPKKTISIAFDTFAYLWSLYRPPNAARAEAYEIIGPRYRQNLLAIAHTLEENGIRFLVITQKVTSALPELKDASYAELYAEVRRRYDAGTLGDVFQRPSVGLPHFQMKDAFGSYLSTYNQYLALAHFQMMRDLYNYPAGSFEIIDGIEALDGHDDEFVTQVHLADKGNLRLAQAIRDRIQQHAK